MKWFERHLNWTVLLVLLVTTAGTLGLPWTWLHPFEMRRWATVLAASLIPLLPSAWVIRRK